MSEKGKIFKGHSKLPEIDCFGERIQSYHRVLLEKMCSNNSNKNQALLQYKVNFLITKLLKNFFC